MTQIHVYGIITSMVKCVMKMANSNLEGSSFLKKVDAGLVWFDFMAYQPQ